MKWARALGADAEFWVNQIMVSSRGNFSSKILNALTLTHPNEFKCICRRSIVLQLSELGLLTNFRDYARGAEMWQVFHFTSESKSKYKALSKFLGQLLWMYISNPNEGSKLTWAQQFCPRSAALNQEGSKNKLGKSGILVNLILNLKIKKFL